MGRGLALLVPSSSHVMLSLLEVDNRPPAALFSTTSIGSDSEIALLLLSL
jgi:hypothetical protein